MDLHSLNQFLVVARLEHLSRAAAELRVAQPSLSRTIARLESELGAPLFERAGRLRLNDTGRIFRDHVERGLGELEAGRRAVAVATDGGAGSLRLAAETFLPLVGPLAAFKNAHPDIDVELHQMPVPEMARALRTQDVDLCASSQRIGSPEVASAVVHHERVGLALPLGHPLADAGQVRIEDLADEPFVTTRRGQWQRRLLDRLFESRGLEPRIVCEGDEPGATYMLVGAGIGVGLFPAGARAVWPHAPAAWVEIDHPDCTCTLSLHWAAADHLPAAARLLRTLITEWDWSAYRRTTRVPLRE